MHLEDDETESLSRDQLPLWARSMLDVLEEHGDHPVRSRCDMLGIMGVDDGDHSLRGQILPGPTFRFMVGEHAAYVWRSRGTWHVSPWHHRQVFKGRTFETAGSFRAALDRLAALFPAVPGSPAEKRPWWRRFITTLLGSWSRLMSRGTSALPR